MKITDNTYPAIPLISVNNTKIKRGWDIPLFNFTKTKQNM